jgi:hypothetical protein
MKKSFLLLALMLFATLIFATIEEYYSFNYYIGTYTPISGTPVPNISQSKISDIISLPFPFPYGAYAYDEIEISPKGWIGLGDSFIDVLPSDDIYNNEPLLAPLWFNWNIDSTSDIQYLIEGNSPNRIVTIQYDLVYSGIYSYILHFQVRLYEKGKIQFVYGNSSISSSAYISASIGISMLPGAEGWFYSINPGDPPTFSSSEIYSNINAAPVNGTIYEFVPVIAYSNDLSILGIKGTTTPIQRVNTEYAIYVNNSGSVTQNNYQIQLLGEDNIVLASIDGLAINSLETLTVTFNWVPNFTGSYVIYAKVVLGEDENFNNNQSPPLEIIIYPEGTVFRTIGNKQRYGIMPFSTNNHYTLFETVLLSEEINCWGEISGIQFYSNFANSLTFVATKVWIGETTNLINSWIPSGNLIKVFDSTLTYLQGQHVVQIDFTTPYLYRGNNLVIMIESNNQNPYNSLGYFLVQMGNLDHRTLMVSGSNEFNTNHPPSSVPISTFPVVTLQFITEGFGPLLGRVHNLNDIPIPGALITFSDNNYITMTNSVGTFLIPYIMEGTYQVTVSKNGYYTLVNNITIGAHQALVANFVLIPVMHVNISGRVVIYEEETTGLPGASINLRGYAEYNSITDNNGYFTINNVLSDRTYDVFISYNNYLVYSGQIVVGHTNLNIVIYVPLPPRELQAEEQENNSVVNLTWLPPLFAKNSGGINSKIENKNERILTGYKIWRFLEEDENNSDNWTLLTPNPIIETNWQDYDWNTLPNGIYKWAVKAIYTDVQSYPAISNFLANGIQIGIISGHVVQQQWQFTNATITCGIYSTITDASGYYSLIVPSGIYNVTASAPHHMSQTISNVNILTNHTTELNFYLVYCIGMITESFEIFEDFTSDFYVDDEHYLIDFIYNIDLDQNPTCTIENVTWLNAGSPQPYIIFNPSATIPPLQGAEPYDGFKELACFGSVNGVNDDLLVFTTGWDFPPVGIQFWARSYSPDNLARFKVGFCFSNNLSDYDFLDNENYIEVPYEWTCYYFTFQDLYCVIQCVSENGAILFLDDFNIGVVPVDDPIAPPSASEILGNYPNPFNPETTIRYSVKETSSVVLEIYNQKGQYITTLVNKTKTPGNYSVIWNGKDYNNRSVSSGIYFYRLKAGKNISTRKMILMK